MITETKIPSIPSVTQSNLTEVAKAVKGILDVREGRSGNRLDSNVTFRDLVLAGFAQVASGALEAAGSPVVPVGTPAPGAYNPSKDMTVPPQPSGVVATGAFTTIMVEWDQPAYGNHAYAEVWASDSDVIGNAVMIGVTSRSVYVDAVGEPSFERYYWVRFVSAANVIGAYNSTSGTYAKTATDVSGALTALAGQISGSELSSSLSTRISLIDGPESLPGSVANRVAQEAAARLLAVSQEASARALAIADEASVRAQAILNEASARANADSALQTQINTLSAASTGDTTQLMAALQEEQAARIAADSAEATSRQTLAAQMRGNYTGTDITQVTTGLLYSEAQARASADSAISTNVTTLSATVATKNKTYRQAAEPTSGMTAGDVWYDSDDGNKAYRYSGTAWVATDDARIAANAAAITTEQTARANADSALATQITTLTATVGSNTAAIQQETTARVNADSALQTQINTLSATSSGNFSQLTAALQDEQTARTNADQAEATARQTLAAQMRGDYTGTDVSQLTSGLIFSELQARVSADGALSQSISSLQATVNNNLTSVNAAIANEQTARANADAALTSSITTLTSTVDTKNKTYRQAAAPTSGMTAGDIWYDSDDSNKPYRYSGTAWVATEDTRIASNAAAIAAEQTARANADSALATQINTLTASVSGNTAAIQQEATARASETGSLFAKYTVKVDVAGHVSGFGLASTANNATPSSSFLVRADQFAVTPPSVSLAAAPTANLYKGMVWIDTSVTPNVTRYYTGSAWSTTPQALPFVIQATPTTLNGVNVAPGVYMPAAFIMDGSIGNVKIGNAAIDDAKVADLSAAKLTAGDGTIGGILKSENYVPGQTGWAVFKTGDAEFSDVVVRGTVYATDGVFNGEVISVAPSGDKARMWSGNFEIYKNVPNVGVTLYKALSRVESGVGANNVQVTIPGYFTGQPRVIVSPANIQLYSADYANQSQSIQCEARSLVESPPGSMVWKFTPLATLSLAANTGQTVINQISGTTQTNWTSSNYTTQANATSVTPNITLASRRGSGASGVYLYRTVRWRVEYLQGGSWVNGAWFTTNLGADANASIISTGTLTFPGAGTWTFRIYAEAYDTSGTTFGSAAYTDSVVTRSRSDTVTQSVLRGSSGTKSLAYAPPSYSVPAGSTLLGIDFSYVYSYSMECEFGGSSRAEISGGGILYQNQNSSGHNITKSWNNRSSNTLTFTLFAYFDSLGPRYSSASLTLHSATAYWRIRTPNAASSAAENNFSFNSYSYSLSSAQVLATGTLNWVAIGE